MSIQALRSVFHPSDFSQDTGQVSLKNIIIPIAAAPPAQRAIDGAAQMAALFHVPELRFHFIHVGPEEDRPAVELPSRDGWMGEASSWEGDVVEHILQVSETRNADLIVMATAGHHGFLDAVRGSTTERVLRGACCPVLAIPAA